jgi:hypothetical protein
VFQRSARCRTVSQFLALEVDSVPSQPAQLARAEASEHRRQQQRPQLNPGMLEHAVDFVLRRDVDADLQRPLVTLRDPGPSAVVACLLADDVARHPAIGHRHGEDRSEARSEARYHPVGQHARPLIAD